MRKRRGITLFITLSVIAAMGSLIAILYGYIEHTRQKAIYQSAFLQAALLKNDCKILLERYLSKKKTSTDSGIRLTIESREREYSSVLQCQPILATIPITWLSVETQKRHPKNYRLAKRILENIIDSSELKEPNRLFDMIQKELFSGKVDQETKRWLRRRSDIVTFRRFKELIDRYRFEAEDPVVETIQWKLYFNFRPVSPVLKLARDTLSPELIASLYGLSSSEVARERSEGELKDLLDAYSDTNRRYAWLFTKEPSSLMYCKVDFHFRGSTYHLSFDYMDKRVENFEFYQ